MSAVGAVLLLGIYPPCECVQLNLDRALHYARFSENSNFSRKYRCLIQGSAVRTSSCRSRLSRRQSGVDSERPLGGQQGEAMRIPSMVLLALMTFAPVGILSSAAFERDRPAEVDRAQQSLRQA